MNAYIAKSAIGLTLQFVSEDRNVGIEQVLVEGQISSDFLQDLMCTCKGKSDYSEGCECLSSKNYSVLNFVNVKHLTFVEIYKHYRQRLMMRMPDYLTYLRL